MSKWRWIVGMVWGASSLCGKEISPPVAEEAAVVVLGGGVGALTSALYLGRGGLAPIVIEGRTPGGALTQSHSVQNWPGEVEVSGFELSQRLREQAELSGALLRSEELVAVDFSTRPFVVTTQEVDGAGKRRAIQTENVIIAMGATPNALGIPGEKEYFSKGVYTCAVCDGGLFKNKRVAVVGGGDSALLEAEYLSNIAKEVFLIVRKGELRAIEEERKEEVLSRENVHVLYHTAVEAVEGDGKRVVSLLLKKKGEVEKLPIDGVFLAIGARPNTQLFQGQLELDQAGYIVLKKGQKTSVEGVYAIGDISDPFYKQAISAAGDGAKAALDVHSSLAVRKGQRAQKKQEEQRPPSQKEEGSVIKIRSLGEFQREMRSAVGPVFVDFYAPWCGPCRQFAPVFDSWAREFSPRIKFLKVDATEVEELAELYQIQGVPTLILLDRTGTVVRRSVGAAEISDAGKLLDRYRTNGRLFQ